MRAAGSRRRRRVNNNKPTRHHGDFKHWPRRSPSAPRGGRPGSPCGPTLPSSRVGSSRGSTTRRRAVRRPRAHDGPCPTFWRRGRPPFRSTAALIGWRGGRRFNATRRSRWATLSELQEPAFVADGGMAQTPTANDDDDRVGDDVGGRTTLTPSSLGCDRVRRRRHRRRRPTESRAQSDRATERRAQSAERRAQTHRRSPSAAHTRAPRTLAPCP